MEISALGLSSLVEALAIDDLSQGFLTIVNNLWAWIALITAAVSFWRIAERRRSCSDGTFSSSLQKDSPMVAAVAAAEDSTTGETERLLLLSASYCVLDTQRSTKGKFTVYYEEDDDGSEDECCDGGDSAAAESEKVAIWCDDWERGMALRMGDFGWYMWQDLTVLDGSVVRLWDAYRRRAAIPLRRRRLLVGGDRN